MVELVPMNVLIAAEQETLLQLYGTGLFIRT